MGRPKRVGPPAMMPLYGGASSRAITPDRRPQCSIWFTIGGGRRCLGARNLGSFESICLMDLVSNDGAQLFQGKGAT